MGVLGSPVWGATIAEPSGRIIWQSGDDIADWDFNRVLNGVSEARIKLVSTPHVAARVEPWLHTLTFWAGSEVAWHGVITETRATNGFLEVQASDGGCFFKRRRVPSGRTWDQADAAQVMAQLVVDSMGVSDPLHVADHLQAESSRVWVVVDHTANSVMVDDVVDDLVDAGLEWTFLGGALLIGPVGARHTTAPLSDRHMGGDVAVTKVGKDVVTDVLVTGDGVWAQRALEDDRIVLQTIEKVQGVVSEQECETRAASELEQRGVAPVMVEVGGQGLRPDAPVSVGELVPGVRIPVSSTQTGVQVGCLLMLSEVKFSQEGVEVTLVQPSVSWEKREEFPPAPAFDHRSPWVKEQAEKASQAAGKSKDYDSDWAKPGRPM